MTDHDFEHECVYSKIVDAYYPLIEACRAQRAYFAGTNDGVRKICPDIDGPVIIALNNAEKIFNFKKVEPNEEPDNAKNDSSELQADT